MGTRKIIIRTSLEIDDNDFEYVKGRLWELQYKIGSWCEQNNVIKTYKVRKYEEIERPKRRRK